MRQRRTGPTGRRGSLKEGAWLRGHSARANGGGRRWAAQERTCSVSQRGKLARVAHGLGRATLFKYCRGLNS